MEFDVFFSISQTPVDGHTPTEREMFLNFFEQVEAGDMVLVPVREPDFAHARAVLQQDARGQIVHLDHRIARAFLLGFGGEGRVSW